MQNFNFYWAPLLPFCEFFEIIDKFCFLKKFFWVIAAPNKHFLGVWYQKWMRNKLLRDKKKNVGGGGICLTLCLDGLIFWQAVFFLLLLLPWPQNVVCVSLLSLSDAGNLRGFSSRGGGAWQKWWHLPMSKKLWELSATRSDKNGGGNNEDQR